MAGGGEDLRGWVRKLTALVRVQWPECGKLFSREVERQTKEE